MGNIRQIKEEKMVYAMISVVVDGKALAEKFSQEGQVSVEVVLDLKTKKVKP